MRPELHLQMVLGHQQVQCSLKSHKYFLWIFSDFQWFRTTWKFHYWLLQMFWFTNLWFSQSWKFHQNDIYASVSVWAAHIHNFHSMLWLWFCLNNLCKIRWKGRIILTKYQSYYENTVQCHHKAVNFLQNIYKRHPIARPSGRGMWCLLWVQPLIDILPHFLQWCVQYHVILDHVITALDCIAKIIAFLFQILTLLTLQFLLTLVYFQIYITEQWHFIKNQTFKFKKMHLKMPSAIGIHFVQVTIC